jgi:hypothetical protein
MRTLLIAITILWLVNFSQAAPALGDKPKWEYAELTFRNIPGRPAGVDADGNEVPATPATMAILLTTGEGQVEAKGWFDLAEKLKVKGIKKDSPVALQKIQLLNYLGGEGWEVMDQQVGTSVTQTAAGLGGGRGGAGGGGLGGGTRTTVSSTGAATMLLKRRAQ